jgi:hypothetical protein
VIQIDAFKLGDDLCKICWDLLQLIVLEVHFAHLLKVLCMLGYEKIAYGLELATF